MCHTPVQVEVLMHHYYCPTKYTERHQATPAAAEAEGYWVSCGCLESTAGNVQITDRGNAMVNLWLRQELPTQAWVDSAGNVIDM